MVPASAAGKAFMTPPPKFTTGSTMRHVAVMSATGSVGLIAIFIVDVLNLLYIAMLGQQELAAAIGFAGTLLFFGTSLGIGISIAGTALTARALGARDNDRARRMAGSSILFMGMATALLSLATLPLIDPMLDALGARGHTHTIAWRFMMMVWPTTPVLAVAMMQSGLLRATGDAKRSMYVTLSGAFVTAALDPLLIFALDLQVDGAAIASIVSRLAMLLVGWHGVNRVHRMVTWPAPRALISDSRALTAIALPAVATNIATPVGNTFVTSAISKFGDSAVAGWAVIGRLTPFAFGVVFALSGAVGPILGQNLGAKQYDRVRRVLLDSLLLTTGWCLAAWAGMAIVSDPIIAGFSLSGEGAQMVRFFAHWAAGLFVFTGALFVANAAFNNLGFPLLSTGFNWGRATLGTIPFVIMGAQWMGSIGVVLGQAAGGVVFGAVAVIVCFRVLGRLEIEAAPTPEEDALTAAPLPPFTSGQGGTAIGRE